MYVFIILQFFINFLILLFIQRINSQNVVSISRIKTAKRFLRFTEKMQNVYPFFANYLIYLCLVRCTLFLLFLCKKTAASFPRLLGKTKRRRTQLFIDSPPFKNSPSRLLSVMLAPPFSAGPAPPIKCPAAIQRNPPTRLAEADAKRSAARPAQNRR